MSEPLNGATEDVLRRIRKLLALAESPNPNEAANAAAKARKLLLEHNLSMEAMGEGPGEVEEQVWRMGMRRSATNLTLVMAGAKLHLCGVLSNSYGTMMLVGRPGNVAAAKVLLDYLFDSMERCTKSACTGQGQAYANDYRHGWVSAVHNRVEALMNQDSDSTEERGLVIREDAAVAKYTQKYKTHKASQPRSEVNERAYTQGVQDGRNVSLSNQLAHTA